MDRKRMTDYAALERLGSKEDRKCPKSKAFRPYTRHEKSIESAGWGLGDTPAPPSPTVMKRYITYIAVILTIVTEIRLVPSVSMP